ncbi:hypothetical protein KO481_18845 [Nocardia sp. NEAU-G5]|uniref:Alpha/beta hydrolase n=1 Tax=Nocardia albiluteola TaxID=2842303 RepID=A0ABS6B2P1_9NOCA|nr:hypothetical protein [Nocardia albiluteola]MBU3063580.1 hypothetical protein [Nocardia albiluteola]
MAVKSKPSQEWTLDSGGTAWAYLFSGPQVIAPIILVAERGRDAAALEAFADTVNGPNYPFGTKLAERGRDAILVSYGPVADWDTAAGAVRSAVLETKRRRSNDKPAVLGGVGRAALVARYVLADLEYEGVHHGVGAYFSLDSTIPTPAEQTALNDVGFMPRLPRSLKITTDSTIDVEGLTAQDDPGLSMFDESLYASTPPADSSWMTEEAGWWLLDQLP